MPDLRRQANGTGRGWAAVADCERTLTYWSDREDLLQSDLEEARKAEDDLRCEAIEIGLANARYKATQVEQEIKSFRRMAERGWKPPDPQGRECLEHAAALQRKNLEQARLRGHEPTYWRRSLRRTERKLGRLQDAAGAPVRRDRVLGERRPAGRSGPRRSSTRVGPGDDPDEPEPPSGRHSDDVGSPATSTTREPAL